MWNEHRTPVILRRLQSPLNALSAFRWLIFCPTPAKNSKFAVLGLVLLEVAKQQLPQGQGKRHDSFLAPLAVTHFEQQVIEINICSLSREHLINPQAGVEDQASQSVNTTLSRCLGSKATYAPYVFVTELLADFLGFLEPWNALRDIRMPFLVHLPEEGVDATEVGVDGDRRQASSVKFRDL